MTEKLPLAGIAVIDCGQVIARPDRGDAQVARSATADFAAGTSGVGGGFVIHIDVIRL